VARVTALVKETIAKWDRAGVFEGR
jgi:hypothetical protein